MSRPRMWLAIIAIAVLLAAIVTLASGAWAPRVGAEPVAVSAVRVVPDVSEPAPQTEGAIGSVLLGGTLSYVDAKYGPEYLALPFPRGTVAEICGPADCVTRRSTDYGPDQRVHPDRIADLSAADFVRVCGVPLSAGLCRGTVELDPPVSPDDDRMRAEDGGPTLPATSTEDAA